MVEISLLGRVTVVVDGRPVTGEAAQRRRLALLALLSDPSFQPAGRDRLMLHLWPESDTESARHLLSSSLHVLRKALGSDAIRLAGDEVELNLERVRVDALAFEAAARAGECDRATALYGGPLLETLGASISPEFEQWLDHRRGELARQYVQCLDALAEAREREGRLDEAVELRHRLVRHDPYSGPATLALMQLLARAGDRAGALEAARSHARLLGAEFGAAPDPAVTGLADQLRADPPPSTSDWPARSAVRGSTGPSPTGAREARERHAGGHKVGGRRRRWPRWGRVPRVAWGGGVVAAGVLLGGVGYAWLDARNETVLAVVPRAEGDPASDYVSFGVAETIDYVLGQAGVRMLNSGSAFLYRDSLMDPREIGRQLEADLLVTVAARRVDDQPRIRVELLRTRNGRRLWQRRYDGGQVEGVARDAIAEITRFIDAPRAPDTTGASRGGGTAAEVRDLYQRGRFAWSQRTPASLHAAVALLEEAVARDPGYAWAHVGLADAYNLMGSYDYGVLPPDSAFPLAKAAATRALALDPMLTPALVARAEARVNHDREFMAAEADFRRAIDLNPGYTPAREWLAYLLIATGRLEEAESELLGALAYSPSSALILTDLAHLEYYRGDFPRAHDYLDRAETAYPPGFERAYALRALALCASAEHEAAIRILEPMAAARRDDDPLVAALLGYALARAGHRDRAEAELAWLTALQQRRFVPREYFALLWVGLGEPDRAIAALEEAAARGSNGILYLGVEPLLAPLRGDPRFDRLILH